MQAKKNENQRHENQGQGFFSDIKQFPQKLWERNAVLYYLGNALTLVTIAFVIGIAVCQYSIYDICHWLKPGKFAFSFALYAYTMAWFLPYLKNELSANTIKLLTWSITGIIVLMMLFMFIQSGMSSSSYLSLGISAAHSDQIFVRLSQLSDVLILANTGITFFVAAQFFRDIQLFPKTYLWAIRSSFIIFNLSCVLGLIMLLYYSQVALTSDPLNLPFTQVKSLRNNLLSMHFFGLHVMQIIPFSVYYFPTFFGKKFLLSITSAYCLGTLLLLLQL